MSFFKRHSSNGVDYKARLQTKLYLSKEAPEPSFDLSDCDLKVVPKGIFSIIKVLRKESLSLHHNSLTSLSGGGDLADLALLTVLDLSYNNFKTLPENIGALANLAELYLNNNFLKSLPEGLCQLRNLRVLSVPFNKLKKLPSSMPNMIGLQEIALQGNLALNELPINLCLCPKLSHLVLDPGRYTFPPDGIVLQGTVAVLSFLANEMGIEYRGISTAVATGVSSSSRNSLVTTESRRNQHMEAMLLELEKKKHVKQREQMAIEKELFQRKKDEFKTHSSHKVDQDKLVEDLKVQQHKIAQEVMKFQSKKDNERAILVRQLKKSEESADVIISRLLEMHKMENDPSSMIKLQELDRQTEEKLFHERLSTELRKKDIIASMEILLKKEIQKVMNHEETKADLIKESLSRELEVDRQLAEILFNRTTNQTALQESLVNDEKVQQAAVAKLLVKSDLESAKLRAQLKIMETQLARLTRIELKRKSLNEENFQDDLMNRRSQLSALFAKTLKQREERASRLLSRLRRMEELRDSEGVEEDYWMKQYQKLLNCHVTLDSRLIELMVLNNVHNHIPILLDVNLNELTVGSLLKMGLSEDQAINVFDAVKSYIANSTGPSAPPFSLIDNAGPSAPSINDDVDLNSECVVCMNDRFEVVYLPCGHLCCCLKCSDQIKLCPLCRTKIEKKVQPIDFLIS